MNNWYSITLSPSEVIMVLMRPYAPWETHTYHPMLKVMTF